MKETIQRSSFVSFGDRCKQYCLPYCSLPFIKTILFLALLLGPFLVYGCSLGGWIDSESSQKNNETITPEEGFPQGIDPGLDLFGEQEVSPPTLPG